MDTTQHSNNMHRHKPDKNNSTSTSGKKTYDLSAVKVKKETMFEPGEHKAALMFDNGIVALVCGVVEYLCHYPFLVAPRGRFYVTFYGNNMNGDILTLNMKYEEVGGSVNWEIRFQCHGQIRQEIGGTSLTILDHLMVFLATVDMVLSVYDRKAMRCTITTTHLQNHGVLQSYTRYNHT